MTQDANMLATSIQTALPLIRILIKSDQPVMLHGAPGIGKSQLVAQLAKEFDVDLIDVRLSMFDPVDLRGIPFVHDGKTSWACPSIWPIGRQRQAWIFFDELTSALPSLQAAAYQAVLERRIGEHIFDTGTYVIAAGNRLKIDKGIVHAMPAPLADRFFHFELAADIDSWKVFAESQGIRNDIIAHVTFKESRGEPCLHAFDGSHTFPTPRGWFKVSSVIDTAEYEGLPEKLLLPLVAAKIGVGQAAEYIGFRRVYRTLPSLEEVWVNPESAKVPSEPSAVCAIAMAISRNLNDWNIASGVIYLKRLPANSGGPEFAARAIKDACKRESILKATPVMVAWAIENQHINL